MLDADRQSQAGEYARLRRRTYFLSLLLTGGLLVVALWLDLYGLVEGWVGGRGLYVGVAVYFVSLMALRQALLFPFSYYSGFRLAHRFGLSNQTLSAWLVDALKAGLIGLALGLLVVQVIYALLAVSPEYWWLLGALFMLGFTVVMANLAPVLILPLFFKLTPLDDPELSSRLERLARQAGARISGVYSIDLSRQTKAANAALAGLGNTRRVLLGDTLLRQYTADEIEVVLAHELGHHAHRDIPKSIAVESTVLLVSLWVADRALHAGVDWLGLVGLSDPAGLPLLGLVVGGIGLLVTPLSNWFTRVMERQADRYALRLTRNPDAFASAMTRLANQNLAEAHPPRWVEALLYDHPSVGSRLEMARRYAAGAGDAA